MQKLEFMYELILIYLNNNKYEFNVTEVMQLLRQSYGNIRDKIDYLIDEGYVTHTHDKKTLITEKGSDYLYENFLNNVDLDKISSAISNQANFQKTKQEIYIPKDFNKRFK